ncbi:hypothetical protein LTR50_007134 [Elasticomyces elasticus]|nr:hypothetical protein LTR50_007134 [Elasticomyces elasticus]
MHEDAETTGHPPSYEQQEIQKATDTADAEDYPLASLAHEDQLELGTPTFRANLQYSDIAYNTLKAENQTLRVESDYLGTDLARARTKLIQDARVIGRLKEKIWLLELQLEFQLQTSQESPDVTGATHDLVRCHRGVSSIEASTVIQEQFYTPSSSHNNDLIRTSADYSSDLPIPTPPQTGATSTDYTILHHLNVDRINLIRPSRAFSDLALAHIDAYFDIEASVERGDTE